VIITSLVTLWLIARRQLAAETVPRPAARADAMRKLTAAAAPAGSEVRQATDPCCEAVAQLGSGHALTRICGVYTLERLAQDNPNQRQTIVNVLCAYLRRPFNLHYQRFDQRIPARSELNVSELQVRLTAQHLFARHLRIEDDPHDPATKFWPDIDIDLTGAHLVDFDFSACHIRTSRFTKARFTGDALFHEVHCSGEAWFDDARFDGDAWFTAAEFAGTAHFDRAMFASSTIFDEAKFAAGATFCGAQFNG
jgi:hypothetical protein